jgi:hypothetical protein
MSAGLVLRVLYRLRSLSEQAPLDSATFSYSYPLLHQVLVKGGIGVTEEDDPLEQVALSLDIIKFHCGECMSFRSRTRRTSGDMTYSWGHDISTHADG